MTASVAQNLLGLAERDSARASAWNGRPENWPDWHFQNQRTYAWPGSGALRATRSAANISFGDYGYVIQPSRWHTQAT